MPEQEFSMKNRIRNYLTSEQIRENEKRILLSILLKKGQKGIYEFKPLSPFFYRCPYSLPGVCAKQNRTKYLKKIDLIDNKDLKDLKDLRDSIAIIFEEGKSKFSMFIVQANPKNVLRFDFEIMEGGSCIYDPKVFCSNHKRVTYCTFIKERIFANHSCL